MQIKTKTTPRDYYRIVLKEKKIIAIYTDNGVWGGVFWDFESFESCKK